MDGHMFFKQSFNLSHVVIFLPGTGNSYCNLQHPHIYEQKDDLIFLGIFGFQKYGTVHSEVLLKYIY